MYLIWLNTPLLFGAETAKRLKISGACALALALSIALSVLAWVGWKTVGSEGKGLLASGDDIRTAGDAGGASPVAVIISCCLKAVFFISLAVPVGFSVAATG